MREKKKQYAQEALRNEFSLIVGKDWFAACSEHFGIGGTVTDWAIAGLCGRGYYRVEEYMRSVVNSAKEQPR